MVIQTFQILQSVSYNFFKSNLFVVLFLAVKTRGKLTTDIFFNAPILLKIRKLKILSDTDFFLCT